jgi:hypothetical protein
MKAIFQPNATLWIPEWIPREEHDAGDQVDDESEDAHRTNRLTAATGSRFSTPSRRRSINPTFPMSSARPMK